MLNVVRRWQMAVAAGNERRAGAFGETLEQIARDGVVFAAAVSELGQDLTRPATTATRTDGGLDRIDGRKIFCTMSPAADVLYTAVTFADERRAASATATRWCRATTPGVVVHDDWDALGMRASGSHSVTFDDVELPAAALRGGFPTGEPVPYMERNLTAGLFHASASLGIAESAHDLAMRKLGQRATNGNGRDGVLAAESTIELAACRAVLGAGRRRSSTPPRGQPDRGRNRRGAHGALRRGPGGEGVHQRGGAADRRPGPGPLRAAPAT